MLATDAGIHPTAPDSAAPVGVRAGAGRWIARTWARASDRRKATAIGLVLFALAAWPVALVAVPPLQDLPNHLATAVVLEHPRQYPQLVANGFFKTNSALFAWLALAGRAVGLVTAARVFVLAVLLVEALALPRFVLAFGGPRRTTIAALFAWPMVHDWFVSMGMLDFALGTALAIWLLVALEGQRTRPSAARAAAAGALAVATWYAHVFPLLVVGLLVALHVATRSTWAAARSALVRLALPMLPAAALAATSIAPQLAGSGGNIAAFVSRRVFLPPWELFYNLWAEWTYGFTWLEIGTLVPCLALAFFAVRRWRQRASFVGPVAFVVLGALYFFSPYTATGWFHVNSRFIPFLWMAALVRVPERLPRWAVAVLGACAVSYSAGMGVDYVRLDRDRAELTAGIDVVPRGARLLPLLFRSKKTSENTRSLLHAWAFYVLAKQTSAPLLFAHSRSFPVTYREPPPAQFDHMILEGFAPSMDSPARLCAILEANGIAPDDCEAEWRARWAAFWRDVVPRFDHVLLWDAPRDVLALVPAEYTVALRRGDLTILARLARRDASSAPARAAASGPSEPAERGEPVAAGADLRR